MFFSCFLKCALKFVCPFLFDRLMEVRMEKATTTGAGDLAVSVEECQCPVGYTGTSCEVCLLCELQNIIVKSVKSEHPQIFILFRIYSCTDQTGVILHRFQTL